MYKMLAEKLDAVSEVLENKGFVKLAHKLDVLANTLEKIAYDVKRDPAYMRMQQALTLLQAPAGDPQIKTKKSIGLLDQVKSNMTMKAQAYKDIPEMIKSFEAFNQTIGFLTSNNIPEATKALIISIQNLEVAAPIINQRQYPQ